MKPYHAGRTNAGPCLLCLLCLVSLVVLCLSMAAEHRHFLGNKSRNSSQGTQHQCLGLCRLITRGVEPVGIVPTQCRSKTIAWTHADGKKYTEPLDSRQYSPCGSPAMHTQASGFQVARLRLSGGALYRRPRHSPGQFFLIASSDAAATIQNRPPYALLRRPSNDQPCLAWAMQCRAAQSSTFHR
jgi:hypothetical protein